MVVMNTKCDEEYEYLLSMNYYTGIYGLRICVNTCMIRLYTLYACKSENYVTVRPAHQLVRSLNVDGLRVQGILSLFKVVFLMFI